MRNNIIVALMGKGKESIEKDQNLDETIDFLKACIKSIDL